MEKIKNFVRQYFIKKYNIPEGTDIDIEIESLGYNQMFRINFDIDSSKMDINSPNYDEDYAKFFLRPKFKNNFQSFFYDWNKRFTDEQFLKITGLSKKNYHFSVTNTLKNYDYLEDVLYKIHEGIKETNFPNVKVDVSKSTNPDIEMRFHNFTNEEFENTNIFFDELEKELEGIVDLSPYIKSWSRRPA